MRIVSRRTLGAAALLSLAVLGPAATQAQEASPSGAPAPGGWVDPPTELVPPAGGTPPASTAVPPSAEVTPPAQPAQPEPPPTRTAPAVRTAEPERSVVPRPRPPVPAARSENAPQRAARPAEEPRAASRAPEIRSADEHRAASRAPEPRGGAAARLPQREHTAQARAAKELAIDYLDFWSDPNAVALEAHELFYAPTVRYHGREMSARALQEEKRRFARRWPKREYRPRLDTLRTSCAGAFCTIRSMFDFEASDPARGRYSSGAGILELGVSFAGGQPVIVSETSSVIRRGGDRTVSLEEAED